MLFRSGAGGILLRQRLHGLGRVIAIDQCEKFRPSHGLKRALVKHLGHERLLGDAAALQHVNQRQCNFTFAQVAADGLAEHVFSRCEIEQVVNQLESHPQVGAVSSELLLNLGGLPCHDCAQPRAGAKEASSLAVDQIQVRRTGDIQPADHAPLNQFTFHHLLRQFNQDIENVEVALLHSQPEGLHVEPVACQHGSVIAPARVGGRPATAAVGAVVVENTNMFAGGVPYDNEQLVALRHATELPIHMDGARLFNATVSTGIAPADYARSVTTVMSCLSKGLCAPVGSLLAVPRELLDDARRERKRLGGAMRQSGIVAAAGLVALRHHVDRLHEDHDRARQIGAALESAGVDVLPVHTNIVAVEHPAARAWAVELERHGVLTGTVSPTRLRLVTHADISDDDVAYACRTLVATAPLFEDVVNEE